MRRYLIALFLPWLLSSPTWAAEIFQIGDNKFTLGMIGTIEANDVSELGRRIEAAKPSNVMLRVFSPGGDWYAAMQMGRLLRKGQAVILVQEGDICISACVLLMAGATKRIVYDTARVGIHRPYAALPHVSSFAEAQKIYRELEDQARAFLAEMNMPSTLWDAMASVPPESVRNLSQPELEAFRLSGVDPAQQELDDAGGARKYGISKHVYWKRKTEVGNKCRHLFPSQTEIDTEQELAIIKFGAHGKCTEDVMTGGR